MIGIKDDNLRSLYACEACQCCLAGITACRSQDNDFILYLIFLCGCNQKMGKYGQCHILEGNGCAVEQLQIISAFRFYQWCNYFGIKLAVVSVADTLL